MKPNNTGVLKRRGAICFGLAGSLVLAGVMVFSGGSAPAMASVALKRPMPVADITHTTSNQGAYVLQLSDAHSQETVPVDSLPAPQLYPLTPEQTHALLSRLPPLPVVVPSSSLNLPPETLPPPKTEKTVAETFAPQPGVLPPVAPLQSLEVVRMTPEGAIKLAPHISVTFNQPMVALSSPDAVAQSFPVKLTPQIKGRWRWVGTETLLFETQGRLPMATRYRVEIPAGTRAVSGQRLSRAVVTEFETPPLSIEAVWPATRTTSVLKPVIVVQFDQQVDSDYLLRQLQLSAGGARYAVRKATQEEIDASEEAARLIRQSEIGRWLAVVPVRTLPLHSSVSLTVPAGTASAEGSRLTDVDQTHGFRTYGPFRAGPGRCTSPCSPGYSWSIGLTNPVDMERFDADQHVKIVPELSGAQIRVYGKQISIQGLARANTLYQVSLSSDIQDSYGQSLESGEPIRFQVGPAPSRFLGSFEPMVVLDPMRAPRVPVYTQGFSELAVTVHRVAPSDWEAAQRWIHEQEGAMPGQLAFEKRLTLAGSPDELSTTWIDLTDTLGQGPGQRLLSVEGFPQSAENQGHRSTVRMWVQRTRLGLVTWESDTLSVLVTDLEKGEPVSGVSLHLRGAVSERKPDSRSRVGRWLRAMGSQLQPRAERAETDHQGRAELPLNGQPATLLVAQSGDDVALLPSGGGYDYGGHGWSVRPSEERVLWYVADDRQLYQAGETLRAKGWLRRLESGPEGDVQPLSGSLGKISWQARDARGAEIAKGDAAVDTFGGFDLAFDIPHGVNLGSGSITLVWQGGTQPATTHHRFRIEAFRRPEFEISVKGSEPPYLNQTPLVASVKAGYYTGEPLATAEVTWNVSAEAGYFQPPGHSGFEFGRAPVDRWYMVGDTPASGTSRARFHAVTDSEGRHHLQIGLEQSDGFPVSIRAEASVADVNRQQWSAATPFLVHPGSHTVGLATGKRFVKQGETVEVEWIVVDLDGNGVLSEDVSIQAERLVWKNKGKQWVESVEERRQCQMHSRQVAVPLSDALVPGVCRLEKLASGRWKIHAQVRDPMGRISRSEIVRWVSGGTSLPESGRMEVDEVRLLADKAEYTPGETAQVWMQLPFSPANVLVSWRREGVLHTEQHPVSGPELTLQVPVTDSMTPGLTLQVVATGVAAREDSRSTVDAAARAKNRSKAEWRPAMATGSLYLAVPPYHRTLSVSVEPSKKVWLPGSEGKLNVSVRSAQGAPLAGVQLWAVVVDEAVLALTDYRLPDPLERFYPRRASGVRDVSNFTAIRFWDAALSAEDLEGNDAEVLAAAPMSGRGAMQKGVAFAMTAETSADGMSDGSANGAAIPIRTDWSPLALFVPAVITDAQGEAEIALKLPDSLTRYRVSVIATDGAQQFGTAESTLVARLPLMLRPSLPRFLNFGDRPDLPWVVHNQSDRPLWVSLAARAAGVSLDSDLGYRFRVESGDRVEVRLPAEVDQVGEARIQAVVTAEDLSDAAETTLPVWTPVASEAFATYGTLDSGVLLQAVKFPEGVRTDFGGLEITTTSTQLAALTDAVIYLATYPFDSTEQIASRIVALSAMKDLLAAFSAEGVPSEQAAMHAVTRDLQVLAGRQNPDGSFGFWKPSVPGERRWPYLAIHTALALAVAQEKGFEVPVQMRDRVMGYLRTIERAIPDDYTQQAKWSVRASALYVLHRMGQSDPVRAHALYQEAGVEGLTLEAQGWLLSVLASQKESYAQSRQALLRSIQQRVSETAAAATFASHYGDHAHLLFYSSRRSDAVVLEGVMAADPDSDLIVKVVRGLLAHRRQGRWANTQENGWVLLALDRYFRHYESMTPDFVARLWLGDHYAGEQRFEGRQIDAREMTVPMAWLAQQPVSTTPLILEHQGAGRLYYRLGMRTVPDTLDTPAADNGFTIERTYEAVDHPEDVQKNSEGVWQIRAGSRVRVRLTLVAPARRYHVALVDRLPAGWEPINPSLAVSGEIPQDEAVAAAKGGRYGFWWQPWYEHQNLRDERAEAFASLLGAGVYRYSYVARATTPGEFVAPPPTVEEMYHPETFGRGAGERVRVYVDNPLFAR